ncbi:interferon lambda receptor 1 isoform X2 [Hyperolius riggenbachi]|uniref:interferon lambda receptor 1 isoform X2 n=1 Tax=Hyperolius riggenbachi TaxID=752182 RepID=UPI0035A2E958
MLPWPGWTLVVIIYILEHVTGGDSGASSDVLRGKIHKPLNISTESRNFSLFLTWSPSPKNPPDVTYVVHYKLVIERRWKEVHECNRTSKMECDLTCILEKNFTNLYMLRVKAVSISGQTSPWANLSENISYTFTVDPAPPVLYIIQGDGTMTINITQEKPSCMPQGVRNNIKHVLEIKNNKNAYEEIEIEEPSTTIKTLRYEGEYCMAVKTKLNLSNKTSGPSNQVCLNFTHKVETSAIKFVTVASVISTILIVLCVIFFIRYKTTHIAKIPKTLDISNIRGVLSILKMPTEECHLVTVNQNMDQASSATFLLCNEDNDVNDYPGCGYTERQNLRGDGSRRDCHDGESTSGEYRSSKGLSVTSSSDKPSSDSSCAETSGTRSEMEIVLTKDTIHLNNDSENTDTITTRNTETLSSTIITLGPLLDTLCVQDSNSTPGGSDNVPLNTLSLAAGTEDLELSENESYESHFTDSDDGHEQLTSDSTDCNTSISYTGPKQRQSQKDLASGYEKKGYMSRY